VCGHVERANRRGQAEFRCRVCGFELNADLNAAVNIRWRADFNQPIAVCQRGLEFELQARDFSRG
jgi:transposase